MEVNAQLMASGFVPRSLSLGTVETDSNKRTDKAAGIANKAGQG
jgi:hypothetical protein